MSTVKDFIAECNDAYKGNMLLTGDNIRKAKNMARLPTGIIQVDESLGGGFPFGKISLIAGYESTGKTQIAMRAAAQAPLFDHNTKLRITSKNREKSTHSYPLYVDAENALDYDWAIQCGLDLENENAVVTQTENSEQCIDIVTRAIQMNLFSCIIIDTLAYLTPKKEIEVSSEDQLMGLHARLLNKAMRKWQSALTEITNSGTTGPAVIMLNQMRSAIGVMFGDDRVLPGGRGQRDAASIIIYTQSVTYDTSNAKSENMSKVTLKGNVHKNKTYIPRQNYSFELYLKDTPDNPKGAIDNIPYLVKRGMSHGLVKTEKGKVLFGKDTFRNQKEFREQLRASPSLELKLYRSVLKASTGVLV